MIPGELPSELRDILSPGNTVRLWFNEGNPNNELRHVRAVVDDEWIVYRFWRKHKRGWFYEVSHWLYFYLCWRDGFLKLKRRGNAS